MNNQIIEKQIKNNLKKENQNMNKIETNLQNKLFEIINRKERHEGFMNKLENKHRNETYEANRTYEVSDTNYIYDLELDKLIDNLRDVKFAKLRLLESLGKSDTETIERFKKSELGYRKSWIEGYIPGYKTRQVFFESPLYEWLTNNETLEDFLNTFEIKEA